MKKLTIACASCVTMFSACAVQSELIITGQVTPAILLGGDIEDPEIVDNTETGSRLRLQGNSDLGTFKVFSRYEIQFQENTSLGAVDGGEFIDTRYAEVSIRGGYGAISLGKGDGAANGTAEASYQVSGNVLGGGHLPFFTVRGTLDRDNAANVGYDYYDGFSRNSRLRYDTPDFAGLSLSASLDNGDRTELAVRLKKDLGPGRLILLAGQADSRDGDNDRTMFSGGYRLQSGLSVAFSVSSRTQAAAPDLDSQLLSLNYQVGNLVMSVDMGEQGLDGENELIQYGFEYHASNALDIYAGWVAFDNADSTSLDAGFGGFRYKF